MRKLFKGVAIAFGVLALAIAALVGVAWWKTENLLSRHYAVNDAPLAIDRSAATLERGQHLYTVLGCVECHGANGMGKLAIDAGPVGKIYAPNLSPAVLGPHYTADHLAAAIRHAVRPDGTPLRIMPSEDFANLSDADTAALVAYLQSLPASTPPQGETYLTAFGRVLVLFGQLRLTQAADIDHRPRVRQAPPEAATADYGAYLAQACTGCHGSNFGGQHVPGTPPEFPDSANLTPHADGLAAWTLVDFERALRTGRRPDGRELDGFMPWRAYGQMSDTEVAALWAHLSTLPPVPSAKAKK
ncbi:c-type cytochrome [Arenimonas oryziterrae]|uniref:Cytochrome c domain-containing protein n=1 Tax=Arenimonas oryziterrae DSM 21050 = YC6267 TaxID=1121015 RepID=A0A091AZQ8_9GAMM|nr:cytochrome c [Arenimonas oryziterrae]KFN44124.1 hypothetical protein N789_06830 [Arenimonas oryziterrae DSM 21050 = YC6267]